MKTQFQNIFKDPAKARELFDTNPEFFRSLSADIKNVYDLIDLAVDEELTSLLNFVK